MPKYTLLKFPLLIVSFLVLTSSAKDALQGILDLRNIKISSKNLFKLNGEWEFSKVY